MTAAAVQPRAADWGLLALLVALWGSSFAMTKVAVGHLDPAWVMALRLLVAGIFLLGVLLVRGRRLPRGLRLWGWFAWLGVIGHAAPFFLISWGTQFVNSGLSGVLMGAIPLFVVVLAHFYLPDERLTRLKAAGFLLGFVGLLVVLGPDKLGGIDVEWGALHGELAILAGAVCYAVHALFARRIPFKGPLEQAAAVCLAGGLLGTAFAMLRAPLDWGALPAAAILSVLGLALLPTAVATLILYRIVGRAGASFVAYSNYLVPVYALAFGALTLGEELEWHVAIGLALIILGIAASRLTHTVLKRRLA